MPNFRQINEECESYNKKMTIYKSLQIKSIHFSLSKQKTTEI